MIANENLDEVLKMVRQVDVRLVCFLKDEKWYLDKIRVVQYFGDKSIPNLVVYPSNLFIRKIMDRREFTKFISNMKVEETSIAFYEYNSY